MKKNLSKMDQNLFVYDISIDHDTVGVSDILNIHKYLMKNMLWNDVWICLANLYCVIKFWGIISYKMCIFK